ncbi:RNA polymerase, sigma subunit, ECF family [Agromyces sp. CF514]|uniref:RNA polymerase sigma factor n=1 Tax=Agromyces sp. CF514 TaxID=1881031 RepID=UPI0008F10C42|nr:sigma-70 family RNA polymerase sigma factor [Agromyces sp. CF514]SFR91598.1 RNA polymerase, sigma subunit, ECF family [Agromyces sp. CF514]
MGEREFEVLFRTYHPVLVSAAYNRLSNVGDAEDAAAEVFAQAWRRRDEAAYVFTIAWLYSALRNVVGNHYRGRTRHTRRVEQAEANHRDPAAAASDDALDVRAAVNRLDPADRELIWMAFWEDLTREEMSEILGCSAATLRVRLHRAKKRLEAALAVVPSAVATLNGEAS